MIEEHICYHFYPIENKVGSYEMVGINISYRPAYRPGDLWGCHEHIALTIFGSKTIPHPENKDRKALKNLQSQIEGRSQVSWKTIHAMIPKERWKREHETSNNAHISRTPTTMQYWDERAEITEEEASKIIALFNATDTSNAMVSYVGGKQDYDVHFGRNGCTPVPAPVGLLDHTPAPAKVRKPRKPRKPKAAS